jgi:hypothetical protein
MNKKMNKIRCKIKNSNLDLNLINIIKFKNKLLINLLQLII